MKSLPYEKFVKRLSREEGRMKRAGNLLRISVNSSAAGGKYFFESD